MAYNSKIVRKVLEDFENKCKTAALEAENKKKELHKKIPEIGEIDKKLADTYKELAGILLSSGENFGDRIGEAKKKNQNLQNRRKLLLKEAGYLENHTEPVYECQNCGDTGYRGEAMCDCLKKELAAESAKHSGFGSAMQNQTFENFNLDYYDKKRSSDSMINESCYRHMKCVCEKCRKFAENFGQKPKNPEDNAKNLIFIGPTGRGKTHMSSAIACEVIKKGFDVFYDSAQSILYSFEKERFAKNTFDSEIIERYMSCDLLIIDDLGTEYSGNMSLLSLYNLVNIRLIEQKSMIISTNLTGNEMVQKYDERTMSRIFGEFAVLNFIGDDIRIKKGYKNQ